MNGHYEPILLFFEVIILLSFRITISEEDGEFVFVRIDEWKQGSFHLFDLYKTTSQMASEMLVYEVEKVSRGAYKLEIDDRRKKFMMC